MSETVIYRGPSGTTIDSAALTHELEANELVLSTYSDATVRCKLTRKGLPLDSEKGMHFERVEVLARLLRRNLPEPTKVIAHMSDQQWADFQGSKAEAA